ncbi:phosphoribosylglycinamide formyltransferase [Corynebacterium ulcerans]|uniref:phosphoribosylglycinamide formyltransferase n=1 Tax=Corynebacterium ulcerans TaxID=65058 RepID=UPI00021854FF|nr:phosphoribosylglycinamide formyltransferase [Corynebacterium ulcerans]AEG81224.1 phosphoribosylglycinamide formyltransferase [Corynebacterium ulcerans 809]PLV99418.1 phosphoribosylglycinamide formyltransferase [Corynebacterium ulcerans]PME07454.1 phosphoribosylglycinamide formyltransferase [Corynebacterium ulcerans]
MTNETRLKTDYKSAALPIVVMASGSGTLLQSIIDHQGAYEVVGVVADVPCPAITRAESAGIPAEVVSYASGDDREAWNALLAAAVEKHAPVLVVSAGFMRILGKTFLEKFPGRIINTHPALLPAFPGAHAVRDALAYGVKVTGSTVHFVDEGVDTGKIIAQVPVSVEPGESEAHLHERIKHVERKLIVSVLNSATTEKKSEEVFFTYE